MVVTRPIPLLAETVAIMAGASPLRWGRMTLAALVGSLAPALLYALTGAAVANFQSASLMFGVVLMVTGLFWLIGRLIGRLIAGLIEPGAEGKKGATHNSFTAS